MKIFAIYLLLIAVLGQKIMSRNVNPSISGDRPRTSPVGINRTVVPTTANIVNSKKNQTPPVRLTTRVAPPLPRPANPASTSRPALTQPTLPFRPPTPKPPARPISVQPNTPITTRTNPTTPASPPATLLQSPPTQILSLHLLNNYNSALTITVRYGSGTTQNYTVGALSQATIEKDVEVGEYLMPDPIKQFIVRAGEKELGRGSDEDAVRKENRRYMLAPYGSLERLV